MIKFIKGEPQVNLAGMPDPIIVTGCARSGTSLVTGLISNMGAWVGSYNMGPGQPFGFFENTRIKAVLWGLMDAIGADPLGQTILPTRFDDVPDDLIRPEALASIIKSAAIINGYRSGPWVIKDAKILFFHRLFRAAFPGSKWVLCERDKDEIVDSCKRAEFMHGGGLRDEDFQAWAGVYLSALDSLWANSAMEDLWAGIKVQRCVEVSRVAGRDYPYIRALMDWLELKYDEEVAKNFIRTKAYGPAKAVLS